MLFDFEKSSDIERDEQVALMLGEPRPVDPPDADLAMIGGHTHGKCWIAVSIYSEGDIPRWKARPYSTDDGLAFKELLSPLQAEEWSWKVGFNDEGSVAPYCSIERYVECGASDSWYDTGDTIAHAIAKTFLALKKQNAGSEGGGR